MKHDLAAESEVCMTPKQRAEMRPSVAGLSPLATSDAVSAYQRRAESMIFTDNLLVVNDLATKMRK